MITVVLFQKEKIKKKENKHPTILKVPDELYAEIKSIFPEEKPQNSGQPIAPYRKVIDGILYVLTIDANGKCYLKNMVLVLHVIIDFKNGMD